MIYCKKSCLSEITLFANLALINNTNITIIISIKKYYVLNHNYLLGKFLNYLLYFFTVLHYDYLLAYQYNKTKVMKKFALTFLFSLIVGTVIAQTSWPMVIKSTYYSDYVLNLNVRNSPSLSGAVITTIQETSTSALGRLVALKDTLGGPATSTANPQTTSMWYKVDLPGSTSKVIGYCAAGAVFTNPECNAKYITVGSSSVYIRILPVPGSPNVTIGSGGPFASIFPGQNFAVCSTTVFSGINYYLISLPRNCYYGSSIIDSGWVSAGASGTLVTLLTSLYNALPPTTAPVTTGITTTTAGLNWGWTYYPSKASFKIYNSSGPSLLGTDADSNPLSASTYTPNSYPISLPTPCTPYTVYVVSQYNSVNGVCVSDPSSTMTFTTTCTGSAPVANFSPSSYTVIAGNTISTTNTTSGTPTITYSWSVLPTTGVTFSNTSTLNPTITFTTTGTYNVTLLATNSYGSNPTSRTITVNPSTSPPIANFTVSPNSINPGGNVYTTNASMGIPAPTYLWSVTPSTGVTISPSSTSTNPSFRFAALGTYTIKLTASNTYGSNIANRTITVTQATPTNNYTCQKDYSSYMAAEPIDVALGSYAYKHTDFNIHAVNSFLNFTRYYNSRNDSVPSSLGFGWSHSYDYSIVNQADTLWNVHFGDGHNSFFIPDFNGTGVSYPFFGGCYEKLFRDPVTRTYTLTFKNKDVYNFDSTGKLKSIVDLNGNITLLSYSGGNLTSIVAPGGRMLTLTYTGSHINTITDPLGRTITYNYDGNGNLILVTNASVDVTGFAYDGLHRITQIVTPNNNTLITNTYDGQSRVISQMDAQGKTTTIAYNTPGTGDAMITYPGGSSEIVHHDSYYRLTQKKDGLGFQKFYNYDNDNNLISTQDENGNVTNFTYDSVGNNLNIYQPLTTNTQILYNPVNNQPTSITDPLGNTSSLFYDAYGNDTAIHLPNGASKSCIYYPNGQLHTSSDALGHITTYSYSYRGDLISVSSPSGLKTFTYDSSGRRISQTDENNHTTSITYNNNDMVTKVTDALSNSVIDSFDADNNLIFATDKNGNHTQFTYDTKDRLAGIVDARGGNRSFGYDVRDNLITVTDANGHTITYGYDAKKQLTSITNSLGTTTFGYDAAGNKISETDATGNTKHYTYDALNRRITAGDALSNTATFTYNPLGQITRIHDPLGRNTGYTYNSVGLLTGITDAASHTTAASYDLNGNRTSITDPNLHTQYFTYDAPGRVNGYTDDAGNIDSFTYDGVGNLITHKKPGGGTITKTYNAVNKVTHVANSTGDNYTYTYDANGNVLTEGNTTGTSSFIYDSLNHLKQYTDMFGNIVQYTYDLAGNKKSIIYPGGIGHTVNYTYDNDNKLTDVADWLGHTTHYNYDPDGRLTSMVYPNGATCNYAYDIASRLTSQTTTLSSAIIAQSIFTLDANGSRTREQRQGAVPFHLTAASFANSYLNDDRLTSDSISAYGNDAMGNRTSEANTTGTTTYNFSVDNILDSFNAPILGTTTYQYDAFGNRVKKTQGGIIRRFVLDLSGGLSQVLMEQDNIGTIKANYIYGLGLIARIDSTGSNIQYYHFDAQHNTVALSNQSGLVTDTYTYDPFGTVLKHTGTTQQPYTFLGQYGVQQETPSLYFVRARYYDAANGRFLSKDPYPTNLSDPQTLNRYVYGVNNPLSNIDPLGLVNSGDNDQWYDPLVESGKSALYDKSGEFFTWAGSIMSESDPLKGAMNNTGSFLGMGSAIVDIIPDAAKIISSVSKFAGDVWYNNYISPTQYARTLSTVFISGGSIIATATLSIAVTAGTITFFPALLVGAGIGLAAYGLYKVVDWGLNKYGNQLNEWNYGAGNGNTGNSSAGTSGAGCGGGGGGGAN